MLFREGSIRSNEKQRKTGKSVMDEEKCGKCATIEAVSHATLSPTLAFSSRIANTTLANLVVAIDDLVASM